MKLYFAELTFHSPLFPSQIVYFSVTENILPHETTPLARTWEFNLSSWCINSVIKVTGNFYIYRKQMQKLTRYVSISSTEQEAKNYKYFMRIISVFFNPQTICIFHTSQCATKWSEENISWLYRCLRAACKSQDAKTLTPRKSSMFTFHFATFPPTVKWWSRRRRFSSCKG